MYDEYDNLNYLAHHGILGMKWGKQNGPPYPLSEAKHDKVVAKAEKREAKKAVKAEYRRKKILKDPKKIVKYQDEFSKEEIETALDKMDTIDKVKSRITESDVKQRIKKVKLSRKKKKLASTPSDLERNMHKFTPDELKEAIQYLKNTEDIFTLKLNRAKRPMQVGQTISDYIRTLGGLFENWNKLRDQSVKMTGKGMSNEQRNKKWIYDNMSEKYFNLFYNSVKKDKKKKGDGNGSSPVINIENILPSVSESKPENNEVTLFTDSDLNEYLRNERNKLDELDRKFNHSDMYNLRLNSEKYLVHDDIRKIKIDR